MDTGKALDFFWLSEMREHSLPQTGKYFSAPYLDWIFEVERLKLPAFARIDNSRSLLIGAEKFFINIFPDKCLFPRYSEEMLDLPNYSCWKLFVFIFYNLYFAELFLQKTSFL